MDRTTRKTSADPKLPLDGDLVARFWSKVAMSDGCWEWTGYLRSGYGSISFQNRERRTHRLSWLIHIGRIPRGKFVLHECDNKKCVRPDHLFLGTNLENIADMRAKGRGANPPIHRGIDNNKATKGDDVVADAHALHGTGLRQREIASRLGVSQSTVWRWVHRVTREKTA